MCGFISGLSIMFHWSIFLFLCQCHTVLMPVALYYSLKSGRLIPPAPFFSLKTTLAIQGLLCLHILFSFFCLFMSLGFCLFFMSNKRKCVSEEYIFLPLLP